MRKLNCILLIDDDEITNFINTENIEELGAAEHVIVCTNGLEALEYLKEAHAATPKLGYYRPELIFLDLNMPVMNGFEFLDKYELLYATDDECKVITMLTTSMRKEDVERALKLNHVVKGYIEKPLTKERIIEVVEDYNNSNC